MLDSIQAPYQEIKPNRQNKKSHFRFWAGLTMIILLVIGIGIGSRLVIFAQKVFETNNGNITFGQFFMGSDRALNGEDEGAVRILLLGIGGEKHEGGTLTDTMILVTVKLPQNNDEQTKVGLMSIPRDLLVYIPGFDYKKINSAYAYGEVSEGQNGPALTRATVERVIGKDIPYYTVIDFAGFEEIIDDLGGIEITVKNSFTDAAFPDAQVGYLDPITFEKGLQKMNGMRALQFVRSRHGNNNEGTDFARSRRQQKVLAALRDKLANIRILTNLGLVDRLLQDFANHLRTNLQPFELKRLYDLTRNMRPENITTSGIDVETGLVCNKLEEETGAYFLVPCDGIENYSGIRKLLLDQFVIGPLQKEKSKIEIQNAAGIELLGRRVQAYLTAPGLQIEVANYQGAAVYQESIIYDNTRGGKPATLEYLQSRLNARVASSPFPFTTAAQEADFVIVVTHSLEENL